MPLDTNFNVDPYYDDFDEAKNFHRILFRPAVAVQARELTQLQTILQNQIERFGDNIFVEGTVIQGCSISTDSSYNYIKLPDLRVDGQTTVPSDYVGLRAVSATTSNLQAIVVNSVTGLESQNPNLHTIYLKYLNTGTSGQKTFAADEQLVFYSNTNPSNTTTLSTSLTVKVAPTQINAVNINPVGTGYAFTVGEGIIFQKGFFIKVQSPITAIISKYSAAPNNLSVGFTTLESVVTEYTDSSLLDNASGYTNVNAPGANRLKLTPTLTVANSDALPSNNFLSIADWNNGNLVRLNQATQYNVINKEMARREYETSGDFVVNQFNLNADVNPANSSTFNALVSSGLAYVNGYRVSLENSSKYEVRKGTDTISLTGQNISASYGNYIIVKEVAGYFTIGSTVTLYDAVTSALSNRTYASISPLGNAIGTATVLSFSYADGTVDTPNAEYYLYLTNIQMNSGKSFSSTRAFAATGNTGVADAVLTYSTTLVNNVAALIDPNFSKTTFYTGKSYVKTLTPGATVNTSFVFRKNGLVNVNSNGVSLAVTLSGNQQFYYGTGTLTSLQEQAVIVIPSSNIIVTNATGTIATANVSPTVTGTSTTFLTSFQENDYIRIANSTVNEIKQVKSIVNNTLLITTNSISNAYSSSTLAKAYPKNIPINFANRNSTIDLANTTSMTFTLRSTANTVETLESAAANVNIYYDVKSVTTAAIQKTINQNRTVCIDTALFLPFAANITCNTASAIVTSTNVPLGGTITSNTASAIVTSTNTAVSTYISVGSQIYLTSNSFLLGTVSSTNTTTITLTANATVNLTANAISYSSVNTYISPGYNIYLSGTNANTALLGTVASVNSTAMVLTANATSNCFTFVSLGGTITSNTASAIVTSTNTAVNTYISAGYKIYLASNSLFLGTVSSTNTTTITLTANATANLTTNTANFSSATNQITMSANSSVGPNGPWYLGLPDVYKLRNVYRVPSGTAFSNSSTNDITSSFALQTNQTDTTYGISQLIRNPGSGSIQLFNGDKLTVVFDVFTIPAGSGVGFFSVDSYPIDDANTANTAAIQTQNIPTYTTSTGQVIPLRDSIDFRAYVSNTISLAATANLATASANAAVINPLVSNTFTSNGYITPDQSFGYDMDYYVGRIDKVHLSPSAQVDIIEGHASESPQAPTSPSTGMTIGSIAVPPYPTLVASQVTPQTNGQPTVTTSVNQTRRYTMKDINGLNKRISKLEYYSSLSLLEQKTKNLVIKNDTTGQDRFKNGIFVDNFESTFGSNLKDPEYFTSFDSAESSIIPRFDQFRIDLQYNTNENANTTVHSHTKTNDVVTLAYTGVPYLTQNTATRYRNCTEGYYNWTGTAFTVPLYDTFVDTRIPPQPPKDPPQPPVPPPPVPTSDNTTPSVPPQPHVDPPAPTFPRPQSGNFVWFSELDAAITTPGDFVNGNVVYNSALGYYEVQGNYGGFSSTVASRNGDGQNVIYKLQDEYNLYLTDPVIPPMPVTIDLPPPPPVEETIIIDTNIDTNITNVDTNNNTFNINDSQQWYDDYNQTSYW
jgi:hypothetical protein